MEIWAIATKLFLALVLGGVIGLEREVNEKQVHAEAKPTALMGLRSFAFISMLGVVLGLMSLKFFGLALLITGALFVLLIAAYILDTLSTQQPGITTELGMIFSFVIGVLLALEIFPIQIILALTVVVILMLSQKQRIKNIVEDIHKQELNAFVSFALIALVILPFLPNTSYALADVPGMKGFLENFGVNVQNIAKIDFINPFKLWLIVALITGVDLIGYILEKTLGRKKGWLIASGVGGFVSSTATTQSLAQESKNQKSVNHLVAAAILANLVSFIQIAFLVGALNSSLLFSLLPILLAMLLASTGALIYFLKAKEKKTKHKEQATENKREGGIIDIGSALKFAGLFLTISIVSKLALELFGDSGFLFATGLGAFIGLDAVMINTAQLAGNSISITLAAIAFILANAVNLFGKTLYSFFQGKREFALKFFGSVVAIIAASLIGLLFV